MDVHNNLLTTCVIHDAFPDTTYHIERHDYHEVDADAGARCGKLPVLLHKIPVDGGKLLHGNETENHHSKHSCQNEGNLNSDDEREAQRSREIYMFKSCDTHREVVSYFIKKNCAGKMENLLIKRQIWRKTKIIST